MMPTTWNTWLRTLARRTVHCAALCWLALPAAAQLLPQLPLPTLPQLPGTASGAAIGLDAQVAAGPIRVDATVQQRIAARTLQVRALIRANPQQIEADPSGAALRRAELVAFAPGDAALQAATAAGFEVLRRDALAGAGTDIVVLRAPQGLSTRRALARLRTLDPQGTYDYNHLYSGSGESVTDRGAAAANAVDLALPRVANAAAQGLSDRSIRVGMIDGGVDPTHPSLAAVAVERSGCNGMAVPGLHGTAVASLLVAAAGLEAALAPQFELYSADVYCGQPTGGAVDALAAAFATLLRARVRVINVSLVGPRNAALEMLVRAVQSRNVLIVAAVGNDGPAAKPLYPAALPGVIAVTAIDARRRALPEAGRGAHVEFAAPGADMKAADAQRGYSAVRGTSFAAPIVSGLLAALLADPACGAESAQQQLIARAIDLGARGRDPVYGFGLVGAAPF